jgi:hypothetical protein
MLFVLLSFMLLGVFGLSLRPADAGAIALPPDREFDIDPTLLGDTERLIALGSVAALFGLYLLLQLSYLFGNPGGQPGSGVSYADAVHRGFTELNVASSICGMLLLILARYRPETPKPRTLTVLEWLIGAQVQVLLISAFYRVSLYEAAYGFTLLRLQVQVYAVVGMIVMVLLILELQERPAVDRLVRRAALVAASAFAVLLFGNADAWIAQANIERYQRSGSLDVEYLIHELMPDAATTLVRALPRLSGTTAARRLLCMQEGSRTSFESEHWYEWSGRRAAWRDAMRELAQQTRAAGEPFTAVGPKLPECSN